jgi:hypothetical protein
MQSMFIVPTVGLSDERLAEVTRLLYLSNNGVPPRQLHTGLCTLSWWVFGDANGDVSDEQADRRYAFLKWAKSDPVWEDSRIEGFENMLGTDYFETGDTGTIYRNTRWSPEERHPWGQLRRWWAWNLAVGWALKHGGTYA